MESCRDMCAHASFHCVTYAFSEGVHECVMSDTLIDAQSSHYDNKSQYNQLFVLFARQCEPSGIAQILKAHGGLFGQDTSEADLTSSSTIEPENYSDAITFESADSHTFNEPTSIPPSIAIDRSLAATDSSQSNPGSTAHSASPPTDTFSMESFSIDSESSEFITNLTTTDQTTTDTSSKSSQFIETETWKTIGPVPTDSISLDENRRESSAVNESFGNTSEKSTTESNTLNAIGSTSVLINESRFPQEPTGQSVGQIPTIGPESGHIPVENVHVVAVCDSNGVNVTITTKGRNYTGSVYAAERFSQCRTLVDGQDEFSLFVPRPTVNNSCNAVQINDTMKVVIVMSNDRVTPFDVTTKDDLFYEVKCAYAQFNDDQGQTNIHSGLVVGGPDPRSIFASIDRTATQKASVVLKITKDGHPVKNVFIGEKLTAVVESDIEPDRLEVIDCNASRIGGEESKPTSIPLISQGCALMPQIMGRMEKASQRLQAPLTAFRIDGSDQIEIACTVLICNHKCTLNNDTCESRRLRRSVNRDSEAVMVDRRLRVYVKGDPKTIAINKNDLCISMGMYISTVAFFGLLLSLSMAFVCVYSKRHPHQFHHEPTDCSSCGRSKPIDAFPNAHQLIDQEALCK